MDERRLIVEQRRRLVAAVLGEAETTMRPHVPAAEWSAFRQKVLDAVGVYHDLVLDVLKVSRDDVVRNERALELLEAIHRKIS
jgi:hypothetical protein